MNWSRIGDNRWVASQYLERIGVPVEGTLNVPVYSQNDPRWAGIRLGTGNTTIGQEGCLLTAIVMRLRSLGFDVTPATLNAQLKQVGGYYKGNQLIWSAIEQLYAVTISEWIECLNIPAPLSRIDAMLSRGEPAIVWVDFDPATAYINMHWVVIIGKRGADDYWMLDPWSLDPKPASFRAEYGDPARYIFRIVSYKRRA